MECPDFLLLTEHVTKKFKERIFREVRTELASPDVNELSTDHSNLINKGKRRSYLQPYPQQLRIYIAVREIIKHAEEVTKHFHPQVHIAQEM